jgi:outer membrane receptor protein involved in Fe transport
VRRQGWRRLALVLAVWMSACGALGQVGSGSLSGVATDSNGAVLPGASIVVTNAMTGTITKVVTNQQGLYTVPDLVVGTYSVAAAAKDFKTLVHSGITLTVGATVVVNFALKPGQTEETIVVTDLPSQVDTTSAEMAALVGQGQMENLPLNGRDFEQLILLAPGVQAVTTGAQTSFYGRSPSYSIAGSRPEGQELLLDGTDIQGFWDHGAANSIIGTSLGVEAIGEFQVLTNSYSARFGGSGSVMNATTRSGTNRVHGEAYDFLRNSAFDARNYFNTTAFPQDAFRQNQFGGTLGAPIKKDRLFSFINYEGVRSLLGSTELSTVPDAQTRTGVVPCSVAPDLPCGPSGAANVPLSPATKAIMGLYPSVGPGSTELGDGIAQVVLRGTQPAHEDYVNTRADLNISGSNSAFVRYVFDNGSLNQPFASPMGLYPEQSLGRNQYLTIGDRGSVRSNLANDARVSFTRTNMRAFVSNSNPALAFFSAYGDTRQDGTVNVPGITSIGPTAFTPDFEIQNVYSLGDDVFWTLGAHSLEMGIGFKRQQNSLANGFFDDQGWTFPNLESFLEGAPVRATDPAITLLGALPGKDNSSRSFREVDLFPYFQDNWRLSRKVNLNLGLRYDFISNPVEIHNQLCAFIAPSNPATTGCTYVPHVFPSNPSLKNFDPRVGFAWDAFANHKTSIRAGSGLFHDPIQARTYHPAYLFAGPYQTAVSVCVFGGPPCSYPTPFQGITVPIPTIGEALEYSPGTTPFVWQYNFSVQSELLSGTVLSLSYVGSHGYHLMVQNDLNPPIPTVVNGQANYLNAPRANQTLGAMAYERPVGPSHYNSLQAYLTRNLNKNLQYQIAYTYSKCIDDGSISTGLEAGNDPAQTQSNPYDLNADRGRCDFDVMHSLVGNAVYTLPSAGNVLTKGWQVSGIVTARSGNPFTVIDGFDQVDLGDAAGDEGGAERPNLVAGMSGNPVTGNPNSWYNAGSFALQPAGTIGNLSRNTLVAPKYVDIDASLAKNTRIWERTNLEIQVEGFNLFNHPNFGLPNQTLYTGVAANGSGIPNPLAGQIVNTVGTSREVQLALKFEF